MRQQCRAAEADAVDAVIGAAGGAAHHHDVAAFEQDRGGGVGAGRAAHAEEAGVAETDRQDRPGVVGLVGVAPVRELPTDAPVEQLLNYVTFGEPAALLSPQRMARDGLRPGDRIAVTIGRLGHENGEEVFHLDEKPLHFRVAGAFESSFAAFDGLHVFVDLQTLAARLGGPEQSPMALIMKKMMMVTPSTKNTIKISRRMVKRSMPI